MTVEDPTFGHDLCIDPMTEQAMAARTANTSKAIKDFEEKPKPKMGKMNRTPDRATLISDEDTLLMVQNQRLDYIDLVGETLDHSKAMSVSAYGGLLADAEKAAHTNIKNRIDEAGGGAIAGAADMVLQMFSELKSRNLNPAHVPDGIGSGQGFKSPLNIPKADLVPGELEVGTQVIGKEFLDQIYGRES